MKMLKLSSIAGAVLAVSAVSFSGAAFADSAAVTAGNAAARLDFQIVIPRVLSFRVGNATAGTVDLISFQPTAAQVGTGTAVAATAGSGDLGNGAVTARVIGNNGQVTISSATTGALNDGGANTIPWTEITTAVTTLTSAAALPAPVLSTGTAVNAPAPVNNITQADARWTFSYANTTVPRAGSYGGANIRNGRVTYTAAMP
jgi:hypothetical protein